MDTWGLVFLCFVAWMSGEISAKKSTDPDSDNVLLVTDSSLSNAQIYRMDLKSQSHKIILLTSHYSPIAVDYDPLSQKLYWTDVLSKQIKSATLEGRDEKVLMQLETAAVMDGLALDIPSQLVFFTDTGNDVIVVMSMDGSIAIDVIDEKLDEPRAIVTDPVNGVIYWTDWGKSAKIEKAYYDGKDRKVIIGTGLGWPNGLVIDTLGNKMYWCDAKTHLIETANLDGTNRSFLLNEADTPLPAQYFGLALDHDTLYFTDWNRRSVMKIGTDGTRLQSFGATGFGRLNGIHVHSHRSEVHNVTNGCSNKKFKCSHMCLPRNSNGHICVCPKGLSLQLDGVSCGKVLPPRDFLLLTDTTNRKIYKIELGTQDYVTVPLMTHYNPISVDYDPLSSRIYWTDVLLKQIRRAGLDGKKEIPFAQLGQVAIMDGLALDVPSQLIFYTDTGNDVIVVIAMDASYSKVIVNETLYEPRAIVTDPLNGIIYWTDWGTNAKIEMAYYDGANRKIIIDKGLILPNGLAVDIFEKKMYWCDAGTHKIEKANLDGTNRIVLLNEMSMKPPAHYFGLALDQDNLYFTDWNKRYVMKIKTDGTELQRFGPATFGRLNDIHVFTSGYSSYNVTNGCSVSKGGCSHVCIPRPFNKRVCLCPDGLSLQSDGASCGERLFSDNFLLLTDTYKRQIYKMDLDTQHYLKIPLSTHYNPICIDYDPLGNRIFWTDVSSQQIKTAGLDGKGERRFAQLEQTATPDGLALDVSSQLLFYTDTGNDVIVVITMGTFHSKVVVSKNLDEPRAIVTDPANGIMYWTDWGFTAKIEMAYYDGTDRRVLINSGLILPNGLALDPSGKKIYWCDAAMRRIEAASVDGSDRIVLLSEMGILPSHFFGLTLDKDILYFTDWNRRHAMKLNTDGTGLQKFGPGHFQRLNDIHVHRKRSGNNNNVINRCSNGNGGCSHICIPRPLNKHICLCPNGLALQPDNVSCGRALITSDFLLMTDINSKQIYKMDLYSQSYVTVPVSKHQDPFCIDYNPLKRRVYWTDRSAKEIRSAGLDGKGEKRILQLERTAVSNGMALDVTSQLLFYTDTGNVVIVVMTMDASYRKHIISEKLNDPREIVTDPVNGIIYWTDWGSSSKIEMAYYNGFERKVIIQLDHTKPTGLAVDIFKKKIYWCDASTHKIETANLDGSNRKVLLNEESIHYTSLHFGLVLDEDTLYFTDWNRRSVMKLKTDGTGLQRFGPPTFGILNDIYVHRSNFGNYKVTNGCSNIKDKCSHMCLPRPSNKYMCLCPNGLNLQPDGVSCGKALISSNFLLLTDTKNTQIFRMDLDSQNYVTIPLNAHYNPICIDYNPLNNRVYWTDVSTKQIKSAGLDGSEERILLQLSMHAIMDGLALDVPSQLLFYTDTGNDVIVVMTIDASYSKVIVNKALYEPRAIVTDPINGIIYWTDWGAIAKIEMAYYDGTGRKVIIDKGLILPNGLAVDLVGKKMYWCDAGTYKLESASLDGSSRKVLLTKDNIRSPHYFGLALVEDTLYFTDWNRRYVVKLNTDGTGLQRFGPPLFGKLNGIHVHKNGYGSYNVTNGCSYRNGGCSHICLPRPANNRVCLCPDGLIIQSNGISCSESNKCPEQVAFGSLVDCQRSPDVVCNYICDAGYQSKVTPQTVVCQKNYTWNYDLRYICVKQCTGQIRFGAIEPKCRRFPTEACGFTCDTDFSSKVTPQIIVCQENSTWNGNLSDICGKACKGQIRFGALEKNCKRFPVTTCSFTCDVGFSSRVTPQTIVCQRNSTWDQNLLDICVKTCQGQIKYGTVEEICTRFPNEACNFTCDAGFISKVTPQTIVCKKNGLWNRDLADICVKSCTGKIQFGFLKECQRFPNDECTFICDDGYSPTVTPQTIVCQTNGSWDLDPLNICVKKCGSQIKFGSIDVGCNRFPAESCNFKCDYGYSSKVFPQIITCQKNSAWDHTLSDICVKKCTGQIRFGFFEEGCNGNHNDVCSYGCNDGYTSRFKQQKVVCQNNSRWDHNISNICVKKCPDDVKSGSIDTECNRFPNDVCGFTCDAGLSSKVISQTIFSQENSTWNKNLSEICGGPKYPHKRISVTSVCHNYSRWEQEFSNICGMCDTEMPNGGLIDCEFVSVGETCLYYCHANYEMVTSINTIICTSQGYWSQNVSSLCQIAEDQKSSWIPVMTGVIVGVLSCITIVIAVMWIMVWRRKANVTSKKDLVSEDCPSREGDDIKFLAGRRGSYSEVKNDRHDDMLPIWNNRSTGSSKVLLKELPFYLHDEQNTESFPKDEVPIIELQFSQTLTS